MEELKMKHYIPPTNGGGGGLIEVQNALINAKIKRLSFFAKFFSVASAFCHCAANFFETRGVVSKYFKNGVFYFKGAKLPDIRGDREKTAFLKYVVEEVFLIYMYYDDNYDRSIVEPLSKYIDAPYGYKDGDFDVTIKKGDVVIDGGAWIGDFSAYCAVKGAVCYAFEPASETYKVLEKTAELNDGKIIPVQAGLSDKDGEIPIFINSTFSGGNSIISNNGVSTEMIKIVSLDTFVSKNNITKIDFIKADIEGAERDMLRGAANVLKKFAPKLAICTYHLPDDREVIEKIILEINPNYKIIHLRDKLFAKVTIE
jgi:FkbM family methyltransferase